MLGFGQKGDYAPFMLATPKSPVYAFYYAGIKARPLVSAANNRLTFHDLARTGKLAAK